MGCERCVKENAADDLFCLRYHAQAYRRPPLPPVSCSGVFVVACRLRSDHICSSSTSPGYTFSRDRGSAPRVASSRVSSGSFPWAVLALPRVFPRSAFWWIVTFLGQCLHFLPRVEPPPEASAIRRLPRHPRSSCHPTAALSRLAQFASSKDLQICGVLDCKKLAFAFRAESTTPANCSITG